MNIDNMEIFQNLKVRDIMTKGIITLPLNTPVKEVAKAIVKFRVHAVCITDEFGELAGIVSDMDVIKSFNKNFSRLTAEDIMSDKVITISADAYVGEAVDIMIKHKIHHLVIVLKEEEKGGLSLPKRPVGILSGIDIVKLMASD